MEVLEVHTINGADIFLCRFPEATNKKQYYASYTAAGNVSALDWQPEPDHHRKWQTDAEGVLYFEPRTPEKYLLFDSLLSEHAARVRLKKMIDAAPFVRFTRSDKSIHYDARR